MNVRIPANTQDLYGEKFKTHERTKLKRSE